MSQDRRNSSWTARNWGPLTIIAALLLALGACLLFSGFAVRMFQSRTLPPSKVALAIPTLPVTVVPVAAVDSDSAETTTIDAAPTVTLRPQPTEPPGSTDAAFAITKVAQPLPLSAETTPWQVVPGVSLTHIVHQTTTWNGTRDVAALWKMAWDDQYLYGLVEVEDDTIAQTESARTAYRGDSLGLEIDTRNDKAAQAQDDDYQFIISPGNFAGLSAELFRFRGQNSVMVDDVGFSAEVVSSQTATGYTISYRIPWSDLRLDGPPSQMGIALNINDNDAPGQPLQEFMLSHTPNRRWAQPATWGTVTLDG